MKEDIPLVCRLCLKKDHLNYIIDFGAEKFQYSLKIKKCLPNIVILENDKLPKHICNICALQLNRTYDFVMKCEKSDRYLKSSLYCNNDFIKIDDDANIKPEFDEDWNNESVRLTDNNTQGNSLRKCNVSDVKQQATRTIKRHKIENLKCGFCNSILKSKSAMTDHNRKHTDEKPYACEFCDCSFQTKALKKVHSETRHSQRERKYICEYCGSRFYRKNDIVIHMRRHSGEMPYCCSICSRRFAQLTSLVRHRRTHTGEKPYSCDVCGKRFADKSSVTKHKTVHSDEKLYQCALCGKNVKSLSSLRTHMNTHTNEKLNVCAVCGATFCTKGSLKGHIQRVHSERAGNCSICGKQFSDLVSHMRKHTGELPFSCHLCQRSFITQRSLSFHIQFKHKDIDRHSCTVEYCNKSFPTRAMLEFHVHKHHNNLPPFVCKHCTRGFFRLSDLSRHSKLSHKEMEITLLVNK